MSQSRRISAAPDGDVECRHAHALGAIVLAALVLIGCSRTAEPDVVLITIDTLRQDHVGAFAGRSPAATPNMDALAADGVSYTQALSPISVTGPAFVTLLTGQNPGTHGVVMNLFRGGTPVTPETITLAERLRERGYATGAFLSGFTLRSELGLATGFQRYDAPGSGEIRRPGDRTAELAINWLAAQDPAENLLLWYHSYDPHGPLTAYDEAAPATLSWTRDPRQLRHIPHYQRIAGISDPDFYAARYAAAVEFADAQVGRIVSALKETGRYDDAIIVLAADHGETLTERELWLDHGTTATAEQLRIPLVVKYPGNVGAGTRNAALVSLADVAPTVLEIVGIAPFSVADGHPLEEGPHARLAGESSHCKGARVLRCRPKGPKGKEFVLRTPERTLRRVSADNDVVWEVYDRLNDPWERQPLDVDVPPADRTRLDALAADRSRLDLKPPKAEAGPNDAERAALEALGYADD